MHAGDERVEHEVGVGGEGPADLDGDCEATIFDFLLFGNWFDAGDLRADLTGDGVLDIFDYLYFLNIFQDGC